MCGFIAIIGAEQSPQGRDVGPALKVMGHRGPDGEGQDQVCNGSVSLGHVRLSIIDTSDAGDQPMWLDQRYCIVFNGEIYNYQELRKELQELGERFASRSDTEVILRAFRVWGRDCVRRFVGMFAFVIIDQERREVFGARDRAGEKPLYYSRVGRGYNFASEIKALFAMNSCERRLDADALEHFLAFGHSPSAQSLVSGVAKLPAGHFFEYSIEKDKFEIQGYWSIPSYVNSRRSDGEILQELEYRLGESVRLQMHADVPVAVLLSGGVDSSLVTAFAARSGRDVRTFCLTFPTRPEQSEAGHADLIARHFGTEHTELPVEEPTVHLLDRLATQFDDPIGDSSMIPTYLISEAISRHCKVAVGGDGGDELFGGYVAYNYRMNMARRLGGFPLSWQKHLGSLLLRLISVGKRGRGTSRMLSLGASPENWPIGYSFSAKERSRLLGGNEINRLPEEKHLAAAAAFGPGVSGMTRADFSAYLIDDLLVKVDRASMLNSLEIRSPLLDHRVIEFAFRDVPDSMKANNTERKILSKRLCAKVLPSDFDLERKQGFSVPYLDWLQRPAWRNYFRETLLDAPDPLFDRAILERYLKAGERGAAVAPQLFGLVMLERWRAVYGISA